MKYEIFVRNWYHKDGSPNSTAIKKHVAWAESEEEARTKCREWNETLPKSWKPVGRKYEYHGS